MKKIITNSYITNRNKPKNLNPDDEKLFINEFTKKIEDTAIYFYKNISYSNNILYKYKFFSVDPGIYKMDTENWNKYKETVKSLITIFKFNQKTKHEKIGKGAWVIDDKSHNFFHWMTDVMSRVQMINKYKNEYPILIPERYKSYDFIKESIKLFDLNVLYFDENKRYIIQDALLTTHAAPAGNYNKKIINQFIEYALKKIRPYSNKNSPKKIYLSRQNQLRRVLNNEEEFNNLITKYDYKIVFPEEMNLKDQIKMFFQADSVISLHGAALTNIMFMKPNSKILEIRLFSDDVRNAFFSLASEREIDYFYFLADAKSSDLVSDLEIDLEKFEKLINEYEKV